MWPVGQASKADQLATMFTIKTITAQRSTLVLVAFWIIPVLQASNSDGSEILDLSSAGVVCSPSTTSSDSFCGPQWTTSLTSADISMPQIDCSHSNQITVRYPNISQVNKIAIPIELLLNCSSDGFQTESICFVRDFGSINLAGPYNLLDDGQNMLVPGSTCYISTCFTTKVFYPYFRTPPISCSYDSPASLTSSLMATSTTIPAATVSTGRSSMVSTPTSSSSMIIATQTHTFAGGNPADTPTVTTRHTSVRVTVSASTLTSTTDLETGSEYLVTDADTKGYSGMTMSLLLLIMFGAVAIVVLMLAVLVWIWCLKTRKNKNKIFFVYNKNDMMFDPFHAPVSVETPAAFQCDDKMSVVSMDVLQSLSPTGNQISLKEHIQIALHSNDASRGHPSYTGISPNYRSSIPHNNNIMAVNQSSVKPITERDDSEEQKNLKINGANSETQYLMTTHCTASISGCESPTLSENNCKHLAEISLDDSAMESDDFSIHTPISTRGPLPELPYCHLNSRFMKHYWNFSPQKRVQKEEMIDLDNNDLGLEDCLTLDDLSNDSASFEQENNIHTVIHLHSPDSQNSTFPSFAQSEENLKPTLSRKDLNNEEKLTDLPVTCTLSGDTLESLSEEKTNTPCSSSSEYIQSHEATSQLWWNTKPLLTRHGDHYEEDNTLDLTAEDDHISEHGINKSIDVQGLSEYSPPLHFTFMDDITCHKPQSDGINLDTKSSRGYLPDDSLHTSSSLTSNNLHCLNTQAMTVLDDSVAEVDGTLSNIVLPTKGCKPDSRCSSNESGYYGYVPSFDLSSFNGNTLTTTTDFNTLPFGDNNNIMISTNN